MLHIKRQNVCWINNFRLKQLSIFCHLHSPYSPITAEHGKAKRNAEERAQTWESGRPDTSLLSQPSICPSVSEHLLFARPRAGREHTPGTDGDVGSAFIEHRVQWEAGGSGECSKWVSAMSEDVQGTLEAQRRGTIST